MRPTTSRRATTPTGARSTGRPRRATTRSGSRAGSPQPQLEIDHSADSPQLQWLERKVRGPGNCRIAFWHGPRFNAGKHSGDDSIESFWDALGGRAKLVLNGHDHNMQRQAGRDGIVQLISGAGGDKQYPSDPDYPGLRFASDASPGACAFASGLAGPLRLRRRRRSGARLGDTPLQTQAIARRPPNGLFGRLGPDQDHVGRVDPDRMAFLARRRRTSPSARASRISLRTSSALSSTTTWVSWPPAREIRVGTLTSLQARPLWAGVPAGAATSRRQQAGGCWAALSHARRPFHFAPAAESIDARSKLAWQLQRYPLDQRANLQAAHLIGRRDPLRPASGSKAPPGASVRQPGAQRLLP